MKKIALMVLVGADCGFAGCGCVKKKAKKMQRRPPRRRVDIE